jgi:hypothetical protein
MPFDDRTDQSTTRKQKGLTAMKQRLISTLAILTIIAAALLPTAARAGGAPDIGSAAQSRQACAVTFVIGRQICYAPSDAVKAERSAPWTIRPDAAVRLTFGLSLSQVSTLRPTHGRAAGTVSEIDYLYGPLRHDYGRQGAGPTAIRIMEFNSRVDETRFKPAWKQQVCGVTVEISPAANPTKAHPSFGPWYLLANTKHGNRSIGIVANTGRLLLQTLACRMLQNS